MNTTIRSYSKFLSLFFVFFLFSEITYAQEETEFVSIDGFKYHIKLGGMQHLKDSVPIVVLEMGAGSTLKSWKPIYNDLIKFAPVFAYERAGIGQSEWNNIEPTPFNAANKLKRILQGLDLKPPYILAGHSWGGVIIRAYAGHYKEDVKALVYIDPMDYEMTIEDEKSVYSSIGVNPDKALKFVEDVTNFFTKGQQMPPGISAEYDVIEEFNTTPIENRNLGKEPNLPLALFVGTKFMQPPPAPPQFEAPFEHKEWFNSSIKQRINSLSKWPFEYSDEGYLFISPKSTHYFHFGEPKMVVDMIRRFTVK